MEPYKKYFLFNERNNKFKMSVTMIYFIIKCYFSVVFLDFFGKSYNFCLSAGFSRSSFAFTDK